jgi:cysteine desulfurase/selenocysteine lyase
VGVLYGKKEILEAMPPYQYGGEMVDTVTLESSTYEDLPYRFEAGTPTIAAAVTLGAACDYLSEIGMQRIADREAELLAYATDRLAEFEGMRPIGTAPRKAAVISFLLGELHPHDVGTLLDSQGVAVRVGNHCAEPIMRQLDIPGTVRASISYYNDTDDLDALVDGIATALDIFGF